MTALKGRQITDFLKKRPGDVHAVLVYGPDAGVVRDRSDALARAVVADFRDPFNFLELSEADVKAEPSRLADEAAALSFAGGERVVRLRAAGDGAAGAVKALVQWLDAGEVTPNALVIVEAGDLKKGSSLRKTVEAAKRAAALPCYEDGAGDVRALIENVLKAEGLEADDDAMALLCAELGVDRGVTRSELEKLILYVGPQGGRDGPAPRVTRADVEAAVAGASGAALDEIAAAAADGRMDALVGALHRYAQAGGSAIAVLRALVRAIDRLYTAQCLIEAGETAQGAMKKLRPPVFFGEARAFEARLKRLSRPALERAVKLLVEAELAAKTTGAPQDEIVERAALRIARLAPPGR